MIAVLGGLADVERDLIRTRTAEGRSRAQKRGQRMGRPSKLTDAQKMEARRHRAEDSTLKELAESYDLGWRRFRGSGYECCYFRTGGPVALIDCDPQANDSFSSTRVPCRALGGGIEHHPEFFYLNIGGGVDRN
jgi:hypothetical protein